ncbi:unnamed protein product [Urochloa humidicola]
MEEDTVEARRDMLLLGGMRDLRSASTRFLQPRAQAGAPPCSTPTTTRSTAPPPYTPKETPYGFMLLSEEEEAKFKNLVGRIMENSTFDNDTLIHLGFHNDIYRLLGNLGWTKFAVEELVDHREDTALEMLVTLKREMRVINNRGDEAPFLSFRLKGSRRYISYESIGILFGFDLNAPEELEVKKGELKNFCEKIVVGEKHTRQNICNIVLQIFHIWMSKRILGRMKEGKVIELELNWLYAALVKKKKINPTSIMVNKWVNDASSGTGKIGMACYLTTIAFAIESEIEPVPKFYVKGMEMDGKFLVQDHYISGNESKGYKVLGTEISLPDNRLNLFA